MRKNKLFGRLTPVLNLGEINSKNIALHTLKVLNFVGIKFRDFGQKPAKFNTQKFGIY